MHSTKRDVDMFTLVPAGKLLLVHLPLADPASNPTSVSLEFFLDGGGLDLTASASLAKKADEVLVGCERPPGQEFETSLVVRCSQLHEHEGLRNEGAAKYECLVAETLVGEDSYGVESTPAPIEEGHSPFRGGRRLDNLVVDV